MSISLKQAVELIKQDKGFDAGKMLASDRKALAYVIWRDLNSEAAKRYALWQGWAKMEEDDNGRVVLTWVGAPPKKVFVDPSL